MRAPQALAAGLLALLVLSGCVHTPAPTYAPGNDNLMALRAHPGGKLAVDGFEAAPKVANTRLGLRGNSMSGGGEDGTYTSYLQQALEAELRNAGRFDPASEIRVSGVLLANELDASGARTGKASIRARFVVTRDGVVVFDKPLQADHEWESSFMGMIAVPAAMENYVATLQKLIGALVADPAFVEASR